MVNKFRTIDFLPEVFKTESNRQFLAGSLDILTSQPQFSRVEGFIGEKYGPGVLPNDRYVVEPSKVKSNYQLDPAVVFLKEDTQQAQDLLNYPGLIDLLKYSGANTSNHDRLFSNDFYSWDPFVTLDKIVNYTQYYWLPRGPDPVPVSTDLIYSTGTYTVTSDNGGYTFSEIPGTNPEITLLRGGTYYFVVPNQTPSLTNFWLQSTPQATPGTLTAPPGLTNNGTSNGTVTFVVPDSSTYPSDTVYYQSGSDSTSIGVINLIESNSTNYIDVADILGKANYTSPNGVVFTNGLKIQFQGNVIPVSYQDKDYYVEGVGTAINLLPVENYVAPEILGEGIYVPYSIDPWDTEPWDIILDVPVNPEYITVERNSQDLNAWTRANRWFHQDVIDTTTQFLGYVSASPSNQPTRAQRPIIEYRGNLRLFNSAPLSVGPISIIDTTIYDAFSQVEGQSVTSVGLIDGQLLSAGIRIVFAQDTNPIVRQNIYTVNLVPLGPFGSNIITLVADTSTPVLNDTQVFVTAGTNGRGTTWRWSGTEQIWLQCQQKSKLNQYPLYDLFDSSGISLSDNDIYFGSTFRGCKLFSFAEGSGPADPVLGFPLNYGTPATIGDIIFAVNLNNEFFEYSPDGSGVITKPVNVGFVHWYTEPFVYEKLTGWVPAVAPSIQYQIFEFPTTETPTTEFICDVPASSTTPWKNVIVYLDDELLNDTQYEITVDNTDLTTTVQVNSLPGTKITILIASDYVSKTAYYQIPTNLQNNPFNTNVESVGVGDIRNQYRSIYINAPGIVGPVFGNNNTHNLPPYNNYGTAIIQNSAPLPLPALFTRKKQISAIDAIQFNSEQYTLYKQLVIDLAATGDYNNYQSASNILEDIIYKIGSTRNSTSAFFWSDMLPSGNPYITNNYTLAVSTTTATFGLSKIYNYESANFEGVAVYLTRVINNRQETKQLLRHLEYSVNQISPEVQVNYQIQPGDIVTVKEYNQTYGSYCPNTPSKLGLYPIFVPGVVLNNTYTTPTYFIRGHDGSYNKLFGDYDPVNGILNDFRDSVLLEFEQRIYNNYKVSTPVPLSEDSVVPGQFRTTDYTRDEILDIYTPSFLNWIGANRVDYRTQIYNSSNKYTYNYNKSTNKLDGNLLQQGYWRGIYNWLYDTDNPAEAPWEMLGLVNKPDWWDTRYGPAPYTSGNTYMWSEIANGYVWNGGQPYTDSAKIRPDLLQILPVDSYGNLVPPFTSVVGNYSSLTFNRNWIVGDGAPTEASYLKSSTWPFDLMRLLALTKPAKFFNLFVDLDRYKFNNNLGQYLYDGRYHLDCRTVEVYGNGVSKSSYINWIVDYVNQLGSNGTDVVSALIQNLDVRLSYSLSGFSGKNYLKFLVEKATPNSKNTSLLIPDESYSLLLYDDPPQASILYSSVNIQKAEDGYVLSGNSKSKHYFTTVVPKPGFYQTVTVGDVKVEITNEYYSTQTVEIPYGTVFKTMQGVSQFLIDYGRYLSLQGVTFNNIENGIVYDWGRMVEEYLLWAQQDWEYGSVISINPNARKFNVEREDLIVEPLTIQNGNFVLNQNLLPLSQQDASIDRNGTSFTVTVLSPGDTVALANLKLYSIEHVVVFDNRTVFNDLIYNLTTGLRQPRLLMQGQKTNNWNGYVDANGFILNENNVKEWLPNVKYPKNKIVFYKSSYYTARTLVEPKSEFSKEDWVLTDYDQIKVGLLPNPSTSAYESLFYYDTNRANLENDADLLAFSLIGFRQRDYLTAADLSDITQINIYKNILEYKGTNLIANAFKGAEFDQGKIDYNLQENWAIRQGDFGSILNDNYVELQLFEDSLRGNPTLIGFNTTGVPIPGMNQTVAISNLINWERPPVSPYFLPASLVNYSVQNGLPSAGYVNLRDAKFTEYELANLNDVDNISSLYAGDIVWLANYKGSWNVFAAAPVGTQLILVENNLNGTATLVFDTPHNLSKDSIIAVSGFDPRVNGFFEILSTPTIFTATVALPLPATVTRIQNTGTALKLVPRRYEQPSSAAEVLLPGSEWSQRKIWADFDSDGQWAVYQASPVFKEDDLVTEPGLFASSIGYSSIAGKIAADGAGAIYRYYTNGGSPTTQVITGGLGASVEIKVVGDTVYCSSPTENYIYIYKVDPFSNLLVLDQLLDVTVDMVTLTGAFAVSTDKQWLYVCNSTTQSIGVYALDPTIYTFVQLYTDGGVPGLSGWGTSIATSRDGAKIIVGAPNETVSGITSAGAAYIYNRRIQNFYGDSSTLIFTLAESAPNNIADVYLNDVLQSSGYTLVGNTLTFTTAPGTGVVVSVATGYIEPVQRLESENLQSGGLFGNTVDTNRWGAEIIIGCPYEISTVNNVPGVEGAVYRYTNAGQRYGVVTGTFTGSQTGTILIDGYVVNYSGTIGVIADAINNQTPANIRATSSGSTLTITVLDKTPEVPYNIIDITGSQASISALGIIPYTSTQILYNFNGSNASAYGYRVKMDERDSLIIAAITDSRQSPTTFDFSPNCKQDDTIFDSNTTVFIDAFDDTGVVYNYTYLPSNNESIQNPGQYAFGQYITTGSIPSISPAPRFGFALAYSEGIIAVGTPYWTTTTGAIVTFTTNWVPEYPDCEQVKPTSWYVDKKPLPTVDINALSTISIYNTVDNTTLDHLDYIDPLQGKILGAVAENIDHLSSIDPAVYSQNGVAWLWDHVGQTWLDLNTLRVLNYHQPDPVYNARYWGRTFPGSTADVYVWVESRNTPLNYAGPGFPLNFDRYTSATTLDKATNSLITKYYFWVKNYPEIPVGKNLSPPVLSQYILNPVNSGISFLAPITTNIVGLYNCGSSIQSNTSALHIGYGLVDGYDDEHSLWTLIRAGNRLDFLPGLPKLVNDQPTSLYLKFIESFAGIDQFDNDIPDPNLPILKRYGTNVRPRQSMLYDRLASLKVYIEYANNILIRLPIVETKDLTYLQLFGPIYDVRDYWTYVNWWAPGYSDDTKPSLEVEYLSDLQTLLPNQVLFGVGGTSIFLEDGLIVKVANTSIGNPEFYSYNSSNSTWTRIGLINGTIQILDGIYRLYGWDSEGWGGAWDKTPATEIYWIIRWLNEKCYINDLDIERNNSLILMFNLIQSTSLQQSNYLPWLNKTSLIDVRHKIRDLLPYKKFQRDNQEFLEGYLNEIKPYHVRIKDFIFTYDGLDTYNGNLTDFDLPAVYDSSTGQFETPVLVYQENYEPNTYLPSSPVWNKEQYAQWFNNYGISLTEGSNTAGYLLAALNVGDTEAYLSNVWGLPAIGRIRIGSEIIAYNIINYYNNSISGLTRGLDDTSPVNHQVDAPVFGFLPSIAVLDTGRAYTAPPLITATIDTTIYPAPRTPAILTPVMASDRLVGIIVENPGSGYATGPEIVITPSIVEQFSSTDINTTANTITIVGHEFLDGDSVVYRVAQGTTEPPVLISGAYYYIRVIDPNTIALYESYIDAVPNVGYEKTTGDDLTRVQFISGTGAGTGNYLELTPRVMQFTSSKPVREFNLSIAFNRVSYTNTITTWTTSTSYTLGELVVYLGDVYRCTTANTDITFTPANWLYIDPSDPELTAADKIFAYYNPTPTMPGKVLQQLMQGMEYPNAIYRSGIFNPGWDGAPWDELGLGWDGPAPTSGLDTLLESPPFVPDPPVVDYTINGGLFDDGYGPEELIAGVVTDTLNFTVTGSYPTFLPPPDDIAPINFRITIDKNGIPYVYNVNPYTQTTFVSYTPAPSDYDAVIQVADVTKLLLNPGDTSGIVYINGEYIRFFQVDTGTNTITKLVRGCFGTITSDLTGVSPGSVVQSVLNRDLLDNVYWDYWWYNVNPAPPPDFLSVDLWGSTEPAAVFLKRTEP